MKHQHNLKLMSYRNHPIHFGFRKALRITNGNQTSGAGADGIEICKE